MNLLDYWTCPLDTHNLKFQSESTLVCTNCGTEYPVIQSNYGYIPCLLPPNRDKLWISDPGMYFSQAWQLANDLAKTLNIWIPGKDLADKNVLEIGCGPGFLGKQIGLIAKSYLGIDYSKLALSIAKLVSPDNCDYIHISDFQNLADRADTIDTMVGRFFFIHQNFDNAIWVLKLARLLLKPGGAIAADFYKGNPEIEQGIVFPAKSPLSSQYPSCGFEYTEAQIQELAKITELKIVNIDRHLEMQRLFVRFEK